jgi:chemotaxis protein MotA
LDFASFIGIISGISLIVAAINMGSGFDIFYNGPGLMIVVGGTVAATLITFQMKDVLSAFKAALFVFSEEKKDPNDMVFTMVDLSTLTRKQGIISLSRLDIDSTFLKKVCNLIADGTKEELMRDTLNIEIESMKKRHYIIQDIFKKMALYAPAFGMLGTLIGLIQMLTQLSNPESVGPSMAVALLTTFYGMLFSTLMLNPIAGKLRTRTMLEVINLEVIFEGAISILQDNNPLLVYEKLSSFVPTGLRRPMKQKVLKNKYA